MIQRYAHLRDETLKQAACLAESLVKRAINEKKDVIHFDDHKKINKFSGDRVAPEKPVSRLAFPGKIY